MKAYPALLWLLLFAAPLLRAADPQEPQTMPLLYDQPGEKYILRIDNRRYQLPYTTKDTVVGLMATINYPRVRQCFDEYKRALEDKAKAEKQIAAAQANANRDTTRVDRLRRSIDSLRAQMTFLRNGTTIDLREINFLQDQIRNQTAQLTGAEDQEARSMSILDKTQGSAEAVMKRADKAREEYARALSDHEKPFANLRTLAMSLGQAL
jgi:hypothetical protein